MIDVALIHVKAGNGGNGKVSFRREKYAPKGGPDGGDGGNGGGVYLVGESNLRTLDYFAGKQRFTAKSGGHGRHKKQEGPKAESMHIKVPQGCIVYEIDGNIESQLSRKALFEILRANKAQLEVIHREGDNFRIQLENSARVDGRWENSETDNRHQLTDKLRITLVGEVLESGQEVVVAKGGMGGRGNTAFKGPSNTTPREAEEGTKGEERWLVLELKMLADVGLVGLPNVGKSTLLSVLTNARPKIADYEFTTLEPNLGVMKIGNIPHQSGSSHLARSLRDDKAALKSLATLSRELVMADIPGLIEGASEGKGLGDEFLRHVERCRVLVHVVAPKLITNNQAPNSKQIQNMNDQISKQIAAQLIRDYETVRGELEDYHPDLLKKQEIVVVNKIDLLSASQISNLKSQISKVFGEKGINSILFVSAGTREGIGALEDLLCKSQG